MIVNNKIVKSGKKFLIKNSFTNKIVGKVIDADKKLINLTIKKSLKFKCKLNSYKRSLILKKTAEKVKKRKTEFANVIVNELGVSFKDALYEVDRVIKCAEISSKICRYIDKDITNKFIIKKNLKPKLKVVSEPLDLVLAITPFNLPMILAAHKIFPAIVAGTPIILKPSEKSPLSSIKLLKTLIKSGLPSNMVNIITGKNGKKTISSILSNPKINLITFTGSSKVGKNLKRMMVAKNHHLKKFIAELGGCSSVIICSDADLKKAVKVVLDGCFKYSGQRCTSVRRVIVEEKIAKKFIDNLLREIKKINFGNPYDNDTTLGPLINKKEAKNIQSKINSSIKKGAKLLFGNKRIGALLSPTILDKVNLKMKIVNSETFGPVCPIIRSKNLKHSIKIASETNFKIAGSIITKNKTKAYKASNELKVGQFSINGPPGYRTELAPFGGFGDSGNGEKEGIIISAENMRMLRVIYEH